LRVHNPDLILPKDDMSLTETSPLRGSSIKARSIIRKQNGKDLDLKQSSQLGGIVLKQAKIFSPLKDGGDTVSLTSNGSIPRSNTKLRKYQPPLVSQYSLLSKLPAIS
jgi:hypothetical protein